MTDYLKISTTTGEVIDSVKFFFNYKMNITQSEYEELDNAIRYDLSTGIKPIDILVSSRPCEFKGYNLSVFSSVNGYCNLSS